METSKIQEDTILKGSSLGLQVRAEIRVRAEVKCDYEGVILTLRDSHLDGSEGLQK